MMRIATLLVAAAALNGCAAYHPKPLEPDKSVAVFQHRSLAAPGLKAFMAAALGHAVRSWPPRSWGFTGLTVAALYYQPRLDLARARWAVAQAGIGVAGMRPNPFIDYTPGLEGYIAETIETAGRRGDRIEQTSELSQAARRHIAAVAWRVRSDTRNALLALNRARSTAAILERRLAVQKSLAAAAEQRFVRGETARDALLAARAKLQDARSALAGAREQARVAEADLARRIGVPRSALTDVRTSFSALQALPDPSSLHRSRLQRQALQGRPDIMEALHSYAAAEAALKLEVARQYPNVTLAPGYVWEQPNSTWTLGIGLTLPVLNHNQPGIARAKAKRHEAAVRFRALQARVIGTLNSAFTGYRATHWRLQAAEDSLTLQRQALRVAQARFDQDQIGRPALLGTKLALYGAEQAELIARADAQQRLGALEDAVQQPLINAVALHVSPEQSPQRDGEKVQ
ncbi:MAG TPA: TolC family protein [Gammaproteobacteria bacterium]|nr:TolC family protein [Gammaproteobacteria bacterium]